MGGAGGGGGDDLWERMVWVVERKLVVKRGRVSHFSVPILQHIN